MKRMTILATDIGCDNHGTGSKAYSFSYLVSENCPDLLQAIKAAATEYCQTEEGKKTYDGNCCNFNIGDFDAYVPDDICLKHGFVPIKHNDDTINILFDDQMVDEFDIFPEI